MRAGSLQRWWGLAVLGGALASLSGGLTGPTVDGIAHAHESEGPGVPAASRLVFREAPVGATYTAQRWDADERVAIEGWSDDDGGAGVRFTAVAGGTAQAEPVVAPDFTTLNRARIDLRAVGASEETPVVFELAFVDQESGGRFWKVVELADEDWQQLDVELPLLRYDRGRIPSWENVSGWGFSFRTAADLQVRSFELWQDGDVSSPYLDVDRLRTAFVDGAAVREQHRGSFVVMTDHPDLDLDAVLAALVRMQRHTQKIFPDLEVPSRPVPLLVFSTEADYRRFWDTYGSEVGSTARPLSEDHGYTWQGIATAWFSDEYGPVRPLYVHEASHALLERSLGVDAQRSWLFEGLGNLEQLDVSGQKIASVYRDGLARSDVKMPLRDLIDGTAIPTSRYWQATLFMEWLLAAPERTEALAAALQDMQRTGSADLRPHLEKHFGMDQARFSAAFWSWAWLKYSRGT
jgi:hypothetical protein